MISDNLIIKRSGASVTLLSPSSDYPSHPASVKSFMDMPANIYFMDRNSIMRRMNDRTAETSGYLSATDAIGKSLRDVGKSETISKILENDRQVVATGRYKIESESYERVDGQEMVALSIKFPMLQNHAVAGIFGCSILLGNHCGPTLSESLTQLTKAGILSSDNLAVPVLRLNQTYFDQRDHAIMRLLVRGKTAKQIARVLALSHRTIEHRIESIKHKLQVKSKADLIEKLVDEFIFLPRAEGS